MAKDHNLVIYNHFKGSFYDVTSHKTHPAQYNSKTGIGARQALL